ncbi:MAG: HNH endonuclease signature motif containing protein [Methylococcales bacterium]|nr:HNH endonuclease signature motif containing protein [Methylococcales bacterium]
MDINRTELRVYMKKILLALMIFAAFLSAPSWADFKRSAAAKNDFKYSNPCPSNGSTKGPCPGYVIDHIQPLACGGVDNPNNMQWQTIDEGKEKDKWERDSCEKTNLHENTRIYGDTNNDGYLSGSEQYLRDYPSTREYSHSRGHVSYGGDASYNYGGDASYNYGGDASYNYGGDASYNYGGDSYIHTGPRGGRYYINSNGNKTYIKH